jgi:tyrosyl-tRNA synthetase
MPTNPDLLTRAVAKVIPKELAEEKLKSGKPIRIYWGIDPTGAKLHLGHAVSLRKMQAFVEAGHHVIFLIGSFTAMIGDPSNQDAERSHLTCEAVEENFKRYKEQASKILDFSKVEIVYNHTWLEKLRFEDIADLASKFTVQQMTERAMFEERINKGKPVHMHEFLYPIMVGYDSVMLDVDCELGGTDQEFNMLCGRTLQQAFGKRDKFVMTVHLIPGTDGRKMSKTYGNCVYVEDPPREMYGKLMSLPDNLVPLYMECCTDIPMSEVENAKMRKSANTKMGVAAKEMKMKLAREVVKLYHGEKAALSAEKEFESVFKEKGTPEEMREVRVKRGVMIVDVMVKEGLASSKSEARRLIEQGGVRLNDEIVKSVNAEIEEGILRVGKRKFLHLSVV